MQYPLSGDEHTAIARCLSNIRKQVQDVSELLANRYGRTSGIAESSARTLVLATLLEHEFSLLQDRATEDRDAREASSLTR